MTLRYIPQWNWVIVVITRLGFFKNTPELIQNLMSPIVQWTLFFGGYTHSFSDRLINGLLYLIKSTLCWLFSS